MSIFDRFKKITGSRVSAEKTDVDMLRPGKKSRFKLTGYNNLVDFSGDGKYILISGYDGGFKVFDATQNKICLKTKLKGPKNAVDIRHHGISFDSGVVAFSALGKVFVMDIARKETVWEFEYSKAERVTSGLFLFFNHSPRLVIPNGDTLLIHDLETGTSRSIALPFGAGWTDCVAISTDDKLIAYKSGNGPHDIRLDNNGRILSTDNNDALDDKIFIYDIATGRCVQTLSVPYPSVRGNQMSLSGNMIFMDNETLLINRNPALFSGFHIKSGEEYTLVNWSKRGYEFGTFDGAKIYRSGGLVLFNNQTPVPDSIVRNESGIATRYATPIPDGLEWILYDTETDKAIYRQKNGEYSATFHPDTKRFAYIERERNENGKRTDYICIRELAMTEIADR
jgi:WD40 repeat protein